MVSWAIIPSHIQYRSEAPKGAGKIWEHFHPVLQLQLCSAAWHSTEEQCQDKSEEALPVPCTKRVPYISIQASSGPPRLRIRRCDAVVLSSPFLHWGVLARSWSWLAAVMHCGEVQPHQKSLPGGRRRQYPFWTLHPTAGSAQLLEEEMKPVLCAAAPSWVENVHRGMLCF